MAHILVVDDEEDLRNATVSFLERKGYLVASANSGNQALEMLKLEKYDLIISDVKMPNGDGPHLLKQMKADFDFFPPVILMTGFSEYSDEELQQFGARAVLAKPVERKVLLETIKKLLEN